MSGLDAARLLWEDREEFQAPWRTATRELETLRRELETSSPLDGVEAPFLRACAAFAEAEGEARDRAWHGPQAYAWTRRSRRLLDACRAEPTAEARAALARHLEGFQAFPLAIAIQRGTELRMDRPWVLASPLALPGTRLSLEALRPSRPVALHDLSGGSLRVECAGAMHEVPLAGLEVQDRLEGPGFFLHRCPAARQDGFELPLHPHALATPDIPQAEPSLRAGLAYQRHHAPLVEAALAHIARFAPPAFTAFRDVLRLAALKPRDWGGFDDYSHADLPGSCFASVVASPLDLGDHLVHELQHNRLQMIEERGPLFAGDGGERPRSYSPWRDLPRGLYGIFHGVFVFIGVYRYWLGALESGSLGDAERAYALDRVLRLPHQLKLALAVLRGSARLTPLGQSLLEQLRRDVGEIRLGRPAGLPEDAPAWMITPDGACIPELGGAGEAITVLGSLRGHVARHDTRGQCADLLPGLS